METLDAERQPRLCYNEEISCTIAHAAEVQFEVIHWSELAEALTAVLVKTSLGNTRQTITISVSKSACGNPFYFMHFPPDRIMMDPTEHMREFLHLGVC